MKKLFERENPYESLGVPRNPFKLELEPDFFHDIALQREANRVYQSVDSNPPKTWVIRLDPDALSEDQIGFYSFLTRSFMNCQEGKYFVFDVLGSTFRTRSSLSGFQAATSRIDTKAAERIFYSYVFHKLLETNEAGVLSARLPSYENVDRWLKEVEATKGKALSESLFYEYQPPHSSGESQSAPAQTKGEEGEELADELEQKLKQKQELIEFLLKTIEDDNLGGAAKTALKTTVQNGIEIGMTSFLPKEAKSDLLGILRLLGHAYSKSICLFIGIADIPFLIEDELTEYIALIAEQEMLIKKSAIVCYLVRPQDENIARDLIAGKDSLQLFFYPELIKKEVNNEKDFRDISLYMLGAFEGVSSELLSEVEKASFEAFSLAEGDWRRALGILEKAIDHYASGKGSVLAGVSA